MKIKAFPNLCRLVENSSICPNKTKRSEHKLVNFSLTTVVAVDKVLAVAFGLRDFSANVGIVVRRA